MSEAFVLELTKTFRRVQPELMHCPLIEMCLHIESAVFRKALEENAMQLTANVWTSGQAIMYYQELRGKVLKNLEYKSNINWRKLYDENRSNPQRLIQELIKDDVHERKPTISKGIPRITGIRKPRILKTPGQIKLKGEKKMKGVAFKEPSASSIPQKISSTFSDNRPDGQVNIALPDAQLDDTDFDLGFDMNEDSLLPESVAWKATDEMDEPDTKTSVSTSANADIDSSMWKMAQAETSQRQKQEQSLRQQQEQERKIQQQRQTQLLQQSQSSSQAVQEIIREPSQRDIQEKLQRERELERKRREEEAKQLAQDDLNLDDMYVLTVFVILAIHYFSYRMDDADWLNDD